MTQPYIHVRGATTSICRRTSYRKAFLAPWHPLVNEIWLYALGDAARVCKVSIHLSRLLPTHHHTDVTPSLPNLPEFTRRLHSDVSCALNQLLLELGYDKPRQIWDGRGPHYLRLLDASAQVSQLVYTDLQHLAAGLVDRVAHVPGRQLTVGMWVTDGLTVAKPPVFFDRTRASEVQVNPEPEPELMRAFGGDVRAAIHHQEKLARQTAREIRAARRWPAMGAQKLQRLHPYDEPRTLAEPGGQRVPTFRIGTRGETGRQVRIAASLETTAFRQEHAETRQRRLEGNAVPFPYGTYGQRVFHGADVKAPYDNALLAEPGPLLHEVMEELESGSADPTDRAELLDTVREMLIEEVPALVEDNELDYRKTDPNEPREEGERPPPETRHRLDRKPQYRENPRRLIVRRDARRGRPKKKRGSDPPSV